MKKIITILLAAAVATTLISCSSKDKTGDNTVNNNEVKEDVAVVYENVDLTAVADSLYDGIAQENMPMVMSMPITEADFEYFAFMPYEEGLEAVVSEPMIGSIAHSVVLVKCPDETTAKRFASSMKENANPRKWVCVEADIVEGVTNGNLAMLLMTTTEGGLSETILDNFKALDAEKIASLKSEVPAEDEIIEEEILENEENVTEDDELVEDETEEVDGEVVTEEENVVVELPEVEAGDAPASGTEEENAPAAMPEVTPEVETPAVEPEVEMPVVTPEVEEVPVETPVETPVVETVPVEPEEAVPEESFESKLDAIDANLYNGISEDNLPMPATMPLSAEDFEYFAFIPYKDTYKAFASEPMMGSIAHSIVVVETASADEAAQVASDMKTNCDPRKWVCVEADTVIGTSFGNYAVLIMVNGENIDANVILENIKAAVK